MKNLKFYNKVCIGVYDIAVQRKKNIDLKKRLGPLRSTVLNSYNDYETHFKNNQLELLAPQALCSSFAADLLSLYDYQSKIIRQVRKEIDDAQIFKITSTCQHCTINAVNSMDHFLAQARYPEFSVHPYNLLPSCGECNGYKGKYMAMGGVRRFLNLYLDTLPDEKYLFVNVFGRNKAELEFEFELRNTTGIDAVLFKIIENHYNSLHLFSRMRLKSVEYITELENLITIRKKKLSIDEIRDEVLESAKLNQLAYGKNHFKYILESALVQSPIFMNEF